MDSTREALLKAALLRIATKCPRLVRRCYWAGTSAISLEETRHRESFDLDFHTLEALADTRPVLSELQSAFPGALEIVQPPDADGSGFSCVLRLPEGESLTLQVLAGFETVPESDLVATSLVPRLRRITLARYLFDKVQCVLERVEARDLVDIGAVLKHQPSLEGVLRQAVVAQDPLLIAERLLGWTEELIREDLRAYPDVDPRDAIAVCARLLQLVKSGARR